MVTRRVRSVKPIPIGNGRREEESNISICMVTGLDKGMINMMKKLLIITVFGVMALQMSAQGYVDPNRSGSAGQLRAQGYVGGFVDTNRNKKIACTCFSKCGADSICLKADSIKVCHEMDSVKRDSLCICRKCHPVKGMNSAGVTGVIVKDKNGRYMADKATSHKPKIVLY